jgi:hypothetical protein
MRTMTKLEMYFMYFNRRLAKINGVNDNQGTFVIARWKHFH